MDCNDCITECPMNGSGLHTCIAVETTPGHGFRFLYKSKEKQTNSDRIRAMSDDELGEFLCRLNRDCYECPAENVCSVRSGYANGMVKWLGEEVSET